MFRLWHWLLATPEGDRSAISIVGWWELRRVPYNVIVGGVGIISFILFLVFISASGELSTGDAVEPLGVLAAPFVFNICYTAGWFVELLVRSVSRDSEKRIGPTLFIAGLAFSLAIVLLPSLFWGLVDLVKLMHFIATGG